MCDAKKMHKKPAASLKKEDEHSDPFQEETRIKLLQIQLLTSTQRKKASKHIVELGPGFFNVFKFPESPIFVDFVSTEGKLFVHAEVLPG